MPLGQFPGPSQLGLRRRLPYAIQDTYGGPAALQRSSTPPMPLGLAILLDVVYNHFGPEGYFLGDFGPYFTDRYRTPWGMAINYDGPESDAVRQFVIDNACDWVRDFMPTACGWMRFTPFTTFSRAHPGRHRRRPRRWRPPADGRPRDRRKRSERRRGWSNRRTAAVTDSTACGATISTTPFTLLLTGERDGYYQDFGRPEQLAKAFSRRFVYDGCYSPFRRRRHGTSIGEADRTRFVVCVQNHDQVGNRAAGDRLSTLVAARRQPLGRGLC